MMVEKCPKCGAEVTQWDVCKSVSQWTCQECGLEEIEHLRNQLKAMEQELLEARTAPREVPDGAIYSQVSMVGEVERLRRELTEAKKKIDGFLADPYCSICGKSFPDGLGMIAEAKAEGKREGLEDAYCEGWGDCYEGTCGCVSFPEAGHAWKASDTRRLAGEGKKEKCERCNGCGRIANDEDGTPWSAWESLPPGSDLAVRLGQVLPLKCPKCKGKGKKDKQ